jgi:hypothetical protein
MIVEYVVEMIALAQIVMVFLMVIQNWIIAAPVIMTPLMIVIWIVAVIGVAALSMMNVGSVEGLD